MSLGKMLLAKELINAEQLRTAQARQKVAGGPLEENLVALGFLTQGKLEALLQEPPPVPTTIRDTGLDTQFLVKAVLTAMHTSGCQTIPEIAYYIKLSRGIVEALLEIIRKDKLVEVRGATDASFTLLRHTLTSIGRERAIEASQQSRYVGPAPVSLADYKVQVQKQTVTNEKVTSDILSRALSHLTLPQKILRQLGPAINSGKPILLYGPSGNGKTCAAEAIGQTFQQMIYIPYCIEVDGHLIKIFDPAVHEEVPSHPLSEDADASLISLRPVEFDPRWVRCRRPTIIAGGELTLAALDLKLDVLSNDYEAPLQVKAAGGVFVIDDFGRQLVRPQDLLNRWIIPLERQVDYLTLHTGKKFALPFDEIVVFSTNLSPEDLMDAAFLRRLHYKLRVDPPSIEDYRTIFRRVCALHGLELPEILSYILNVFYPETGTSRAAFHPRFIVEHVIAACNYEGVPPQLTHNMVNAALQNLRIVRPAAVEG